MELIFWGTRGSFAVQGKPYLQFGGATSCISLEIKENHIIIVDAGTGLRDLGRFLLSRKRKPRITLFITHFHLDHIMGLPSFQPLYDPETIITFYSPIKKESTLTLINHFMGGRFFPLSFSQTPCQKEIHLIQKEMEIDGFSIRANPLPHPGGNLALRFEKKGLSLVYATDVEPPEGKWDEAMIDFAREATYLIGEAMFTPEEYAQGKKGWGHSSFKTTVSLAQKAGCRHLILTHWNPDYDDRKIKQLLQSIKREFPQTFGAKAGWKINLN